eukprot:1438017-Rhodomonas_salina.1
MGTVHQQRGSPTPSSRLFGRPLGRRSSSLQWFSGWETDSLPSPGNRQTELEVVAEHAPAEWTDFDDGPGPGPRRSSKGPRFAIGTNIV